jgi:hypothetical protein
MLKHAPRQHVRANDAQHAAPTVLRIGDRRPAIRPRQFTIVSVNLH